MPYKQNPKSPILKALVGKQSRLPQHLQDAIKAAPESPAKKKGLGPAETSGEYRKRTGHNPMPKRTPAKMYNSPAKAMTGPGVPKEANKTGTAGSTPKNNLRDRSKPPGASGTPKQAKKVKPTPKPAPAAPKPVAKKPAAKPKYDKELNSLVSQRKGLKKGTAEYNKVQNRINEKLGSKVRRRTIETTKVKNKAAASKPQGAQLKKVAAPAKPTKTRKIETVTNDITVSKVGGGARKGGTTVKVSKNIGTGNKKTVVKTKGTRTVTKTKKDGTTTTKTNKRVGARIKGAVANAKANRAERRANDKTIQARKAAKAKRQSKRADRLEARATKLRK